MKDVVFILVLYVVARITGVEKSDICSSSRKQRFTTPRHLVSLICHKTYKLSAWEVADSLGMKSHSTVINACRNIRNIMDVDNFLSELYGLCLEECTERIKPSNVAQAARLIDIKDKISKLQQELKQIEQTEQ